MHDFFADLLGLLADDELIKFGVRAEKAGKLTLATAFKTELLIRKKENREIL